MKKLKGLDYIVCAHLTDDAVTSIVATHRKLTRTTSVVELSEPIQHANASQLRVRGILSIHIPANRLVAALIREAGLSPREHRNADGLSLAEFARAVASKLEPRLARIDETVADQIEREGFEERKRNMRRWIGY